MSPASIDWASAELSFDVQLSEPKHLLFPAGKTSRSASYKRSACINGAEESENEGNFLMEEESSQGANYQKISANMRPPKKVAFSGYLSTCLGGQARGISEITRLLLHGGLGHGYDLLGGNFRYRYVGRRDDGGGGDVR